MNLLTKIRHATKGETANGNGARHVRLVQSRPTSPRSGYVLCAAETAPCTCPDFCERDHDNE